MFFIDNKLELAISFDTTGSMYPCIGQVRREVEQTVKQLMADIPGIRIAIIAHGDYCDAVNTYVTKKLDFTTDEKKICDFVRNVGRTYGGDSDECYELVLHETQALSWTPNYKKALILIGDAEPHKVGYRYGAHINRLDWREEAKKLADMGVCVYSVQALSYWGKSPFYTGLAELTNGLKLELDQFTEIIELIRAVSFQQYGGNESVEAYEKQLIDGNRYNRSLSKMFDTMLKRGASESKATKVFGETSLKAVKAGRFQVLKVDTDISIREFVQEQGLIFKTGRGFYEFTKPETIQSYKEVILRDKKTGDMYSGAHAREMLGLPIGTNAKIRPVSFEKYQVFVQSTSYNRKLIGGTEFLYEAVAMASA